MMRRYIRVPSRDDLRTQSNTYKNNQNAQPKRANNAHYRQTTQQATCRKGHHPALLQYGTPAGAIPWYALSMASTVYVFRNVQVGAGDLGTQGQSLNNQ